MSITTQRIVSHCLIFTLALGFYFGTTMSARAANVTVNVDYNSPRQTLEGFGASVTWVANDLDSFSPAKQTQILDLLYNTSQPGAGLSWVRVGSFLCEYNPSPGVFDWNYWGIQSGMRWLQRVNTAYGINKYMVSSWSPPAFMKDNNSCTNGGHVLSQFYPNLAALKIQWLQNAKTQLGFEAQVESVQNEPNQRATYDSCEWTTAEMSSFVANHMQPALASSGLTSKLMLPEASFYSNFDNSWGFPLLNDAGTRAATAIVATHGYGRTDNFSTPCNSCAQYNKPIWQTEDSNLDGKYNGSIDEGMTWSTEIYKALNGGRFNAWFYWWVMTLQNDNQGLINANPSTDSFQVPKRLYVLGQFSRFIRPGSVVLGSTSSDSTLQVTAVRPATGNVAIVLANTGRNSQTVTVNLTAITPLTVAEGGFGKRTEMDEYRLQSRGGKGIITMKTTEKTGRVIGVQLVGADDQLMLITNTGKIIRLRINDIRVIGRNTQGVRLIDLDEGERVVSLARLAEKEEEDEEEKDGE